MSCPADDMQRLSDRVAELEAKLGMCEWEYHSECPGISPISELLNAREREGWQYVGPFGDVMIFKRQRQCLGQVSSIEVAAVPD